MGRILISCVLWVLCAVNAALRELNYRLIVIEEEEVPLAAGDVLEVNRFFPIFLVIMATILVALAVTVYVLQCRKYRQRIGKLCENKTVPYAGWNLKRLKEVTNETEWKLAEESQDIL